MKIQRKQLLAFVALGCSFVLIKPSLASEALLSRARLRIQGETHREMRQLHLEALRMLSQLPEDLTYLDSNDNDYLETKAPSSVNLSPTQGPEFQMTRCLDETKPAVGTDIGTFIQK